MNDNSDIIDRLRRWTHDPHALAASDLMDHAADEIARLRLTDAEREALEWFADYAETPLTPSEEVHAATLRGLLKRTAVTEPMPKET